MENVGRAKGFAVQHPVVSYLTLTFAISWLGALALVAPRLLRGQAVPEFTGILMFPVMLLGPVLSSIVLTYAVDGRPGIADPFLRMGRIRVGTPWYILLLVPPVLVLGVLFCMATFFSPVYTPNRFIAGISFGIIAGFFEEVGWMGYAFPKMLQNQNALGAGITLGALWGLWHLPVIDYLGTATPHGAYWLRYFLAFTAVVSAMRVLIAWIYTHTNSVALAQLMHATGSLVVFSPTGVTAEQEAQWHAPYAVVLWLGVGTLAAIFGKDLRLQSNSA